MKTKEEDILKELRDRRKKASKTFPTFEEYVAYLRERQEEYRKKGYKIVSPKKKSS